MPVDVHCDLHGITIAPPHTMLFIVETDTGLTHQSTHYPILQYNWREWKVSHLICPVPTVHPIPLHCEREWTHWGCAYCPSHPTVLWEGMDELQLGLYQIVPFATLCPECLFTIKHIYNINEPAGLISNGTSLGAYNLSLAL